MTNKMAMQPRIRFLLIFFMCGLAASGLTAIPLRWELKILMPFIEKGSLLGIIFPAMIEWMERISDGLQNGYGRYPFLAYGTDWLAFGHVAIALSFFGPLRDPVRNIWVIEFGIITCILVIPWVLIFGAIRDIPFFWQLIDISFGISSIIPLWLARRDILKISREL